MQIKLDNVMYDTVYDPNNKIGCISCSFRNDYQKCKDSHDQLNCADEEVYYQLSETDKPKVIKISSGSYAVVSNKDDCSECYFGDKNCPEIIRLYDCEENNCNFKPVEESSDKIIDVDGMKYKAVPHIVYCTGCHFYGKYGTGCSDAVNQYDCSDNGCTFVPIQDESEPDVVDNTIEAPEYDVTVKYFIDGMDYYHSIVQDVGSLFGIKAYTSDDGSIQDTVLAAKVYELVTEMFAENAKLKSQIAGLKLDK